MLHLHPVKEGDRFGVFCTQFFGRRRFLFPYWLGELNSVGMLSEQDICVGFELTYPAMWMGFPSSCVSACTASGSISAGVGSKKAVVFG